MDVLSQTQLGQDTTYVDTYDPAQLFAIPRSASRDGLALGNELPFQGEDVWNAYELSWLDQQGKPQVAIAEVRVPASSDNLVESKSFKLYLNSFANTRFADWNTVADTIAKDIGAAANAEVNVSLHTLAEASEMPQWRSDGQCLDDLSLLQGVDEEGPVGAEWLAADQARGDVTETLYSHLVRSLCPVTGQPDWATVEIHYQGQAIDRQRLLQYLVSFRRTTGFHEHIVEQSFQDIMQQLAPQKLWVRARFTRRGGLDINPYRSNYELTLDNHREIRQ